MFKEEVVVAETENTATSEEVPEDIRAMFADTNFDMALQIVLDTREKAEEAEETAKQARRVARFAEISLIQKMMEGGVDSFKALGKSVSWKVEKHPSVLKENKPALYEWLRESGYGALVVDWVFPQTLKSFVNKEYQGPLPEFVKIFEENKLSIRAGVTK